MSVLSKTLLVAIIAIVLHVLTIVLTAVGDGVAYYLFLGNLDRGHATGIGQIEVLAATVVLIVFALSLRNRHNQQS